MVETKSLTLAKNLPHLTNSLYRMVSEAIAQLQLNRRLMRVGLLRHIIQTVFVTQLKMSVSKPCRNLLSLDRVGTDELHQIDE